jgi:hypothetical protein
MKRSFFAAVLATGLAGLLPWAPPAAAQGKTTKECVAEWNTNKSTIQASGKTRRTFIAECRGVPLAAAAPKRTAKLGKAQFASEAEAKASCPSDTVVWVNLRSRVYHASDSPSYGKTRRGAYMCEKETAAAGYRATKAKRAGVQ